jgi:inorganic pyrophosphatase
LQRFFKDYKKLEKKQVVVEDFLGPDEAIQAVLKSMRLYSKMFSYLTRGGQGR